MISFINQNLVIIPELFLTIWMIGILVFGVSVKKNIPYIRILMSCGIFLSIILLISIDSSNEAILSGRFVLDEFAKTSKIIILFIAAIAFLIGSIPEKTESNEYYPLLLLIFIGAMCSISCTDILSFFIALEIQGLGLYIIVANSIKDVKRGEAALKYFIIGSLGSGLFLYGSSLVYGETGTLFFDEIKIFLENSENNVMTSIGAFLIFISLFFKLSIAPFHVWSPDVFEKTPFTNLIYVSTFSKLTAVFLFVTLLIKAFSGALSPYVFFFLALLSIAIGAFGAFRQENFRRLLGYSSIINMGFVLLAIGNLTQDGYKAGIMYTIFYVVTSLIIFAKTIHLEERGFNLQKISQLNGFIKVSKFSTIAFTICFFSLAGIPPLTGFLGKVFVIKSLFSDNKFTYVAIIAVAMSVVAASYYLNLIKNMIFPCEDSLENDLVVLEKRKYIATLYVFLLILCLVFMFFNPMFF